jgi:hypothetical protein
LERFAVAASVFVALTRNSKLIAVAVKPRKLGCAKKVAPPG